LDIIKGPPEPMRWPNDAKICVSIGSAFESFYHSSHFHSGPHVPGKLSEISISYNHYASKAGVWRLFDIFERHGISVTFSCNGKAAQEQPVILQNMLSRGHDIAAHGWSNDFPVDGRDREACRVDIERTLAAIIAATGQKPTGWVSPGARGSDMMLEILVENGLTWTGDDASDDIPWVRKINGKPIVILPRTNLQSNDLIVWMRHSNPGSVFSDGFKDAFDYLYKEGERGSPKWVEMVVHTDIGSRPALAGHIEKTIDYVKSHDGVWFARRSEIAAWALKRAAERQ
jgi:allantoinase